jgi:hypothetical protein
VAPEPGVKENVYPLLVPVARTLSTKSAAVEDGVLDGPSWLSAVGNEPYVVENDTDDVLIVRSEATAEASFAAIFDRIKFGIAIAAMIKMIATTINNSMSEKPFCLFLIFLAPY